MTDKVQRIKEWISKTQDGLMDDNGNFENTSDEGAFHILSNLDYYIDSLQEGPEPQFKVGDIIRSKVWELAVHEIVSMDDSAYYFENGGMVRFTDQGLWELAKVSELLNTESMIESYKQRLISQANGVKNSPLIDMCLASYKHGINETLDTLNLSKVQRIGKEWKEEPVSIWHDSNGEQPNFAATVAIWSPKCKNEEIISRCTKVYPDRIWAYIDDLLKM